MVILVTALCLTCYWIGYRFYGGMLSRRVFRLEDDRATPAHTLEDGVDYVPTRSSVLFAHHYASITGLSPILGPAVAVIWGWGPAMLWVVAGALLIGCVHDFGALVVSMRARGMSIGKVTEGIVGARAKTLFHLIIFFGIALAMGVFVYVIATLFAVTPEWDAARPMSDPTSFPSAVLPTGVLMLLAVGTGWLVYRRGWRLWPLAIGGLLLCLLALAGGMEWPLLGLARQSWPQHEGWISILLIYALVASVLPVWSLLQTRDFLNALLLYLGLGLAYLGIFLGRPEFAAPVLRMHPEGAPSFVPFVFIIIACGAVSGFHSLVSSGTTAKQLDRESHARIIGYGGMIGESLLGLLAVVACTAGVLGAQGLSAAAIWRDAYGDWSGMQSLGRQVGLFITGAAHFIEQTHLIDHRTAVALVAVVVVSFAMTTLDSATRLLRFNIAEIGQTLGWKVLENRFVASSLAVVVIAWFAFYEIGGQPAGLALWRLFGTTNQLLAGLALLVVTLYLAQRGRNPWYTGIPMGFMLVITIAAMVGNLGDYWAQRDAGGLPLFVVGSILFVLAVWLVLEAVGRFRRVVRGERLETMSVPLAD